MNLDIYNRDFVMWKHLWENTQNNETLHESFLIFLYFYVDWITL